MGFFDLLKAGLAKTKKTILSGIDTLFSGFSALDDAFYEELEELLILADVGVGAAEEITGALKERVKEERIKDSAAAKEALVEILVSMLDSERTALSLDRTPAVILVIGVNGVGKTTSIAKIASFLKQSGKTCLIAAADTFRAAAIDQLEVWAERAGVDLIKQQEGSDPAAVVFDAVGAAKHKKADILIIDTAGRLHNKKNLMDELSKINRVLSRELPDSSRETLLVLDATTGQNAVLQAKEFKNTADITGLVLTKLDGTAKGGVVFSIKKELDIPVKFIGVGERMEDLQPFDKNQFVAALFGE